MDENALHCHDRKSLKFMMQFLVVTQYPSRTSNIQCFPPARLSLRRLLRLLRGPLFESWLGQQQQQTDSTPAWVHPQSEFPRQLLLQWPSKLPATFRCCQNRQRRPDPLPSEARMTQKKIPVSNREKFLTPAKVFSTTKDSTAKSPSTWLL